MLFDYVAPVRSGWRKASYSTGNGACVEVVSSGGRLAVRDSQDPSGPVIIFGRPAWSELVSKVKSEVETTADKPA
jgi:Domain of unknown function (DUF397)